MATKLKTYEGVDIYVDEDGRFSAELKGKGETTRKNLSDLEKIIHATRPRANGWPGIWVTQYSGSSYGPHGGSVHPNITRHRIVGIRETGSRRRGQIEKVLVTEDGKDLPGWGARYELTEEQHERLRELSEQIATLSKDREALLSHERSISTWDVEKRMDLWQREHPPTSGPAIGAK